MATLPELLKLLVDRDGSDLHIATNTPPQIRVHGHLQRLTMPDMQPAETKQLVYSVLTDAQKKRFEETQELDFSFGIKGLARFRCNVFNQRGAVGAVYRLIPEKIRTFGELGLPAVLATLSERPRGLVLVTGPTGSGKSTTLAAMPAAERRPPRILVVDDERSMRELLAIVLRREGYEVLLAENGRSAVAALERESVDLLISDIKMPDMSGVDVLRAAKKIDPDILGIMQWGVDPIAQRAWDAPALDPRILQAIGLIFVELMLVTGIALFFSTFSTPLLSAALTFGLVIVGHFSSDLRDFQDVVESSVAQWIARGIYWVLPNLAQFDVKAQVVHGQTVPAPYIAMAVGYAALYVAMLLVIAGFVFSRRDFK